MNQPSTPIPPGIISDPFLANAAISSSITPVAFVDSEKEHIIYVNHSFLSIWGYSSSDEIIGKNASLFWETHKMKGSVGRKINDKGGWIGEIAAYKKDGSQFPVQISTTMLVDQNSVPLFLMLSFLDISERIKAQEVQQRILTDLQERVKELDCLYNILSIKFNKDTSIESLLQHIVAALPLSLRWPEFAYARIAVGSIDVHSKNYSTSSSLLTIQFNVGQDAGFLEVGYYNNSNSKAEMKLLKEEEDLLRAASKEIVRLIEQKRDEDELRSNRERLLHADKLSSIGVLSAEIMHEIGNPNNFIALNTKMLSQAWKDIVPILDMYYRETGDFSVSGLPFTEARQEITRLLEGIAEGSERIRKISSYLRTFVSKKQSSGNKNFSINEAVKKAIEFSRCTIDSCTDNFQVVLTRKDPVIRGDSDQIQQIVINLLTNAYQALFSRQDLIRLSTIQNCADGTVSVIVEDEGAGISQEDLPYIMDPFFTTKKKNSVGLGLSISNDIAVSHGGKLLVHSVLNQGTRVELVLPAVTNKESE